MYTGQLPGEFERPFFQEGFNAIRIMASSLRRMAHSDEFSNACQIYFVCLDRIVVSFDFVRMCIAQTVELYAPFFRQLTVCDASRDLSRMV